MIPPDYPIDPDREGARESSARLLRDDTRFAMGRVAIFQYVVVAVFVFLLAGFWVLQVRDHEVNSELAERNRVKIVPLPAPRGKILDRDGRVIVDNQPSFTVMLSQENLKAEHLDAIAAGLSMDPQEVKAMVARYHARSRFALIPLKQELTPGDLAFVESHRDPQTFPEMELVQTPRRLYPQNGLAAHVIGYVGEVSDQDLNSSEFAKYSQGERVGKFGLERQYNEILMGVDGQRRVVVDNMMHERAVLEDVEATPGQSLQTTLDLDLQAVAELSMEDRKGAVVALDPRSGEILAMVSRPAFDPSIFAGHVRSKDWNELINNPDKPLMNRAIQAQFAPGSTFKPIVALAGLETGALEPSTMFYCPGSATFYGKLFHCDVKTGHGTLDLHRAIVHSCDVYFFNVGNRINIDTIAEYAQMAGLGKKTGVDLPSEAEGVVPSSKWKLRTQREKWYAGETISVAIGQGPVTVTPIQLATAIGGLAMGGEWRRPHLVKETAPETPRRADLHAENIATVVSGMYGVVNEGGTGASAHINGIQVCGKTGSAQRISNELAKSNRALAQELKDNGWFVGFAPCDHPEIVVAALWEASEHGYLAAPIVRDVIKAYFDKKQRLTAVPKPPEVALFRSPVGIMQ
ncbi:MAG TPA: penicillin-binding protein 2 [Bryobacteraceae bacterium]|nr:penicillin-binding protein 2 [Bryobacteraceae bacterium]